MTATEPQFSTNEFSILDKTLAHDSQCGPKVLIFVPCQVHVIDDENTARTKSRDRLTQLEDLPPGCVGKYQVKLTETTNGLRPIP